MAVQLIQANYTVGLIEQDNFVIHENELPMIADRLNWEMPDSINWELLLKVLSEKKRQFDYVILEGILDFSNVLVDTQYDYRIYLELDKKSFLQRRSKDRRWGLEPYWYLDYVWEAHLVYGKVTPNEMHLLPQKNRNIPGILKSLLKLVHD